MKFAALVVCCLMACSGSTVAVAALQPTTETVEPKLKAESSPDPEPAPVPAAPSCANASTETPICDPRDAAIPPSFWCAEFYGSKDDKRPPLDVCYSTKETCALVRQQGLDAGDVVGECRTSQQAYCFTMLNASGQRIHWRCYDAMEDCKVLVIKAMEQRPRLKFGECGLVGTSRSWTDRE